MIWVPNSIFYGFGLSFMGNWYFSVWVGRKNREMIPKSFKCPSGAMRRIPKSHDDPRWFECVGGILGCWRQRWRQHRIDVRWSYSLLWPKPWTWVFLILRIEISVLSLPCTSPRSSPIFLLEGETCLRCVCCINPRFPNQIHSSNPGVHSCKPFLNSRVGPKNPP